MTDEVCPMMQNIHIEIITSCCCTVLSFYGSMGGDHTQSECRFPSLSFFSPHCHTIVAPSSVRCICRWLPDKLDRPWRLPQLKIQDWRMTDEFMRCRPLPVCLLVSSPAISTPAISALSAAADRPAWRAAPRPWRIVHKAGRWVWWTSDGCRSIVYNISDFSRLAWRNFSRDVPLFWR